MGYTTDFNGELKVTPALKPRHAAYLRQFAETRRMKRDAKKTEDRPDPVREAAGLGVGPEGGYFVGEGGYAGQDDGPDVLEHNEPPTGQPGLWCQWVPNEDGSAIVWDEGEKFYNYVDWLDYLIANFLKPWGYRLDGDVEWQGEESDDRGIIHVENNKVTPKAGGHVADNVKERERLAKATEILRDLVKECAPARGKGKPKAGTVSLKLINRAKKFLG